MADVPSHRVDHYLNFARKVNPSRLFYLILQLSTCEELFEKMCKNSI